MLGIRMIKSYGNSICKPLSIILNDCLNMGKSPHEGKKPTLYLLHKKGNKSLKNYRPIFLLPICSNIFERLICNEMLISFTENNLTSSNQWGFRTGALALTNYRLLVPTKFIKYLMVVFKRGFLSFWQGMASRFTSQNLLEIIWNFYAIFILVEKRE